MKNNEFMLVRHSYDDHSYIDGKNDTSLTQKGIEIAKKSTEIIVPKIETDKAIIRHSSKIRAKETSEIIADALLKKNISCECIEEPGLTELFQGRFDFGTMEHKDRVDFLQSCWDDFEGCRKERDLSHHFGQNKDSNIVLTPGECHSEWSARIAKSVLNILDDVDNGYQSINVTHRGAIFEITKIIEMANSLIDIEDVELYETVWMNYCQDYILDVLDIGEAKTRIENYIDERTL